MILVTPIIGPESQACAVCGAKISTKGVDAHGARVDDPHALEYVQSSDGPIHLRCYRDTCHACGREADRVEHPDGTVSFRHCGRHWVPVARYADDDPETST